MGSYSTSALQLLALSKSGFYDREIGDIGQVVADDAYWPGSMGVDSMSIGLCGRHDCAVQCVRSHSLSVGIFSPLSEAR